MFRSVQGKHLLESSMSNVLCFAARLLDDSSVAIANMQPYLSAISTYQDLRFPIIISGPLVSNVGKGMQGMHTPRYLEPSLAVITSQTKLISS